MNSWPKYGKPLLFSVSVLGSFTCFTQHMGPMALSPIRRAKQWLSALLLRLAPIYVAWLDVAGCQWPPCIPSAKTLCGCVRHNLASQLQVRKIGHLKF